VRLGRFGSKPEVTNTLVDACRELQALPAAQRREAFATLSHATQRAIRDLDYEWILFARPEQLAPAPPWRWWVMCGGRGGGKTRSGVEEFIDWAHENPGSRMAIVGKDAGSVRRIQVLGNSGILRRSPPWFKPRWYKTDKLLVWPNDTMAETHSAEEPQTLRGPEYHKAWVTELFHWGIPKGAKEPIAWQEGIKLGLRLGQNPQGIIDSSPRSTEFCADLLMGPKTQGGGRAVTQAQIESGEWRIQHALVDEDGKEHTYVIAIRRWSSERNAENLAPGVIAEWRQDLRGSRLEEQELDGKILVKVEGALWSTELLDAHRVNADRLPRIVRTLVAVDPTRVDAPLDEAGIMVGGLGEDGRAYVWDDCSLRGSPDRWGRAAVAARNKSHAEAIVREKNRLDQALKDLIKTIDPKVKWIDVQATEGKRTRAEPVSALYEQGKVSHVRDPQAPDRLAALEDEMISYDPRAGAPSPNRMDALVWLITALLIGLKRETPLVSPGSITKGAPR
jgi:phage terminase large subunit-like protein